MITIAIVAFMVIAMIFAGCSDGNSNDAAEKDENGRYLTINNQTNQIINEVNVTVGEGTEIESMRQTNPDEVSFSIEIPKQYSEYTTFTVTLIDRYNLKYQKTVTDVKPKGRTEVTINEGDYIEQDGDWMNRLDQFFNGD